MSKSEIPTVLQLRANPLPAALLLTLRVDSGDRGGELVESNPSISDDQTVRTINKALANATRASEETLLPGTYEVFYSLAGGISFSSAPKGKGAAATKELLQEALLPMLINLTTTLVSAFQTAWPDDEFIKRALGERYTEALRTRLVAGSQLGQGAIQLIITERIDERQLMTQSIIEALVGNGYGDPGCTNYDGVKSDARQRFETHQQILEQAEKDGDITLSETLDRSNPFFYFINEPFVRHIRQLYAQFERDLYRDAACELVAQLEEGAVSLGFEDRDDMLTIEPDDDANDDTRTAASASRRLRSVARDLEQGDTIQNAVEQINEIVKRLMLRVEMSPVSDGQDASLAPN